jgi:tetratricopeptide (TPR) repeat protein
LKYLAGLAFAVFLLGSIWSKYITHDGLVDYYDHHPKASSGASVLCYLGKGYQVTENYQKMLAVYGRVVERYPASPYTEDAWFGHALALERLNKIKEAIDDYNAYLEKYPDGKYARSVRNNIEILRSR